MCQKLEPCNFIEIYLKGIWKTSICN